MKRFTLDNCIAQNGDDAINFLKSHISNSSNTLFIGTVGVDSNSVYYPILLAGSSSIEYKFLIEKRPVLSSPLEELGKVHKEFLIKNLAHCPIEFKEVEIIAEDGATVAGRNAVRIVSDWLEESNFSDIIIDTTGMSRGTCFPIVHQAIQIGLMNDVNVHMLVASKDEPTFELVSESNDRAEWMHGFQGDMGRDSMDDALKLWIPQLSEGKGQAASFMYSALSPVAEVCPIIPFPSHNPRRGDNILFEYKDALTEQWDSGLLNIVYAHEANPLDVYRSVSNIHKIREEVFAGTGEKPVTVLSPSGWRIGSLGMLLASIDLKLPILYVETLGYNAEIVAALDVTMPQPDHTWHIWLTGSAYAKISP